METTIQIYKSHMSMGMWHTGTHTTIHGNTNSNTYESTKLQYTHSGYNTMMYHVPDYIASNDLFKIPMSDIPLQDDTTMTTYLLTYLAVPTLF